jgi:hypothetical protein
VAAWRGWVGVAQRRGCVRVGLPVCWPDGWERAALRRPGSHLALARWPSRSTRSTGPAAAGSGAAGGARGVSVCRSGGRAGKGLCSAVQSARRIYGDVGEAGCSAPPLRRPLRAPPASACTTAAGWTLAGAWQDLRGGRGTGRGARGAARIAENRQVAARGGERARPGLVRDVPHSSMPLRSVSPRAEGRHVADGQQRGERGVIGAQAGATGLDHAREALALVAQRDGKRRAAGRRARRGHGARAAPLARPAGSRGLGTVTDAHAAPQGAGGRRPAGGGAPRGACATRPSPLWRPRRPRPVGGVPNASPCRRATLRAPRGAPRPGSSPSRCGLAGAVFGRGRWWLQVCVGGGLGGKL